VEHRFRDVKKRGQAIRLFLKYGGDPLGDFPNLVDVNRNTDMGPIEKKFVKEGLDISSTNHLEPRIAHLLFRWLLTRFLLKTELAKMFGGSSAGGVAYQIRGIKANSERMKAAANAGRDPKEAFVLGSTAEALAGEAAPTTPGTNRKRKAPATAPAKSAPGSRTRTGGAASSARGGRPKKLIKMETTDKDESSEKDYDELDREASPTPAARRARANTTLGLSRASTLPTESEVQTPSAVDEFDDDDDEVTFVKEEKATRKPATTGSPVESSPVWPPVLDNHNPFTSALETAFPTSTSAPTATPFTTAPQNGYSAAVLPAIATSVTAGPQNGYSAPAVAPVQQNRFISDDLNNLYRSTRSSAQNGQASATLRANPQFANYGVPQPPAPQYRPTQQSYLHQLFQYDTNNWGNSPASTIPWDSFNSSTNTTPSMPYVDPSKSFDEPEDEEGAI